MANEILIEVDHVSKRFCRSPRVSMRYAVKDAIADVLGKPVTGDLRPQEFWSLRDISLQVRRGECLAVIGPNGSGKSTLMKIVSGIYRADQGEVAVNGRICSLIEVGAGFHPLLSGRENIYLNCAMLGMGRDQVNTVIHQIIEFAGIDDFIDMPVRTYSSGMFVRLGFSVAVHSHPDVLIIDEVLAVGDAGFRAKCYNKIQELAESTAILFVSHSMQQVSRIATRTMVLQQGMVIHEGEPVVGINTYYRLFANKTTMQRQGSGEIMLEDVRFNHEQGKLRQGAPFRFECLVRPNIDADRVLLSILFRDINDDPVLELNGQTGEPQCLPGVEAGSSIRISVDVDALPLCPGYYSINLLLTSANRLRHYDWVKNFMRVEVTGDSYGNAPVLYPATWKTEGVRPNE